MKMEMETGTRRGEEKRGEERRGEDVQRKNNNQR